MREHDSLVESVLVGLSLSQRAVDVDAGYLAPGRNTGIIHTTPAGDAAFRPLLGIEVWSERGHENEEVVLQVVEPHAHYLRALVGQGPHVDVLPVAVLLDQVHGDLAQLLDVEGEVDLQNAAALVQPLVVLLEPKQVHLAVLGVPVAPNAFEAGSAVVQGVRHDADFGLGQRHEFLLEERYLRH